MSIAIILRYVSSEDLCYRLLLLLHQLFWQHCADSCFCSLLRSYPSELEHFLQIFCFNEGDVWICLNMFYFAVKNTTSSCYEPRHTTICMGLHCESWWKLSYVTSFQQITTIERGTMSCVLEGSSAPLAIKKARVLTEEARSVFCSCLLKRHKLWIQSWPSIHCQKKYF